MAVFGVGCQGSGDASGPRFGGGARGADAGSSSSGSAAVASGTGEATAGQGNATLSRIADQYFPGQVVNNAAKRMFRLTRTQLDLSTKTLLPKQYGATALSTLPRDPLQTNYEYADNLGFNSANFTPFINWVAQIASAVEAAPTSVIDCTTSDNSAACLDDRAKQFVSRAFRGTVSDAVLARYSAMFTASVASVGLPRATADLVELVLTSPNYVFRDEVQADASGLLLPAEQLQNLSYTLADAPPEALGLSSATPSVYLQTPELAQHTIDQFLASAEAHAKLLRFFLAWLEVKEPDEFAIATSVFPEFTAEVAVAVVNEAKSFLERQLSQAAPKMRDLTESTQTVIPDAAAFLYGKSGTSASSLVNLDPAQRLGIFTLPAVIASHSGPTTSRLVKRGVFFVRKVMCMPLGSPPPDVDTSIPSASGASERQRVEAVTAQPRCAGCHAFINPFGFMLENYDAIGRFRTSDQGVPIDSKVNVTFIDPPISATSPVEALRDFTRSSRFQQCFARQLFRFYSGRDETPGDDPVLRQMFFDFAKDDAQDIVHMLHTLASSATFPRRSEVP